MNSPKFSSPADLDARVTRFGLRVAAGLTEQSSTLPHDVSERLRFAREQALARASQARAARTSVRAASTPVVQLGATLALGGGRPGDGRSLWSKWASVIPLGLLVAGLLLAQRGQLSQQLVAAAEVDTALLSDHLPPAAFSDPGFAEFLRDGQE
jgi:hypothetical protein